MPLPSLSSTPSFRTYSAVSVVVYVLYIALSSYYQDFNNFTEFLQHQYEHFWTDVFLLNLLACGAIFCGSLFIYLMFGQLRAIEEQNIRDKVNHYALYKFVFLFGVLNLDDMGLVTKWAVWSGLLAGVSLLNSLTQDRAQYLSLSPSTTVKHHLPGIILSSCLHILTVALFFMVLFSVQPRLRDLHITLFLLADVVLFYLKTLQSLVRYSMILYEMHLTRWENKDVTRYYAEISFDVIMLTVELLHNLHMLFYGGLLLSMGSFVLCMHIKHIYNEIKKRWIRHKNFRAIVDSLDVQFQTATKEELEANNDHCAICWEGMESARKLPCGHLFHIGCLRGWLEHDTSCPTCRHVLANPNQGQQVEGDGNTPVRNMAWQFRGSRWASWLPNFSIHVIASPGQFINFDSNRNRLVDQVQEVLPHISRHLIEEDLRNTGSSIATIENLLQNRSDAREDDDDEEDDYEGDFTEPLPSFYNDPELEDSTLPSAAASSSQESAARMQPREGDTLRNINYEDQFPWIYTADRELSTLRRRQVLLDAVERRLNNSNNNPNQPR